MNPALTLDMLITEALEIFAPADAPTRYYSAALKHAQKFRRELVPRSERMLKTAFLDVGTDVYVPLPDDYTQYTVLGLQCPGWGTARNLIYNADLSKLPNAPVSDNWLVSDGPADFLEPPTEQECAAAGYGVLDADADADADAYRGYGAPCHAGEFRIDHEQGCIYFPSLVPEGSCLVLEYYAFAATPGEDIPIDELAHSWGVAAILRDLFAQRKDWASNANYAKEATFHKAEYKRLTNKFSEAGVRRVNHQAAAQRNK